MKHTYLIIFLSFFYLKSFTQKKYCYTTANGRIYKLNLFESDDASSNVIYDFYESDGSLIKRLEGKYSIVDEGVYSTLRKIVAEFEGNIVKWLILYDGNGNASRIQDELKSTIWDRCY